MYIREVNEHRFAQYLFRPNQDEFIRFTPIGFVLLNELHIMERYVTTTYRLQELNVCIQGVYCTAAPHVTITNS